ncbi:MAG: hypothetical protein J4F98_00570 [Acidobacteria bacterium]|nr:hypothetical protein [Acidobacteriota bacterium]
MLSSHFALMVIYAVQVSLFFAVLWRRRFRDRVRLFVQMMIGMVGGGLVLAWLMYPFPLSPPAPIP